MNVKELGDQGLNLSRERDFCFCNHVQTGSGSHLAACAFSTEEGESKLAGFMKLITCLHFALRLSMQCNISPTPLHL
jgi:hypothetical protein